MRNRIFSLRRQEGQALVELALVLPLLLFLLFAIVDFGEALNQYNDTTNLANLGVRAAAVASSTSTNPTCSGEASATLTGYLQCEGALDSGSLANVTVTPYDSSGCDWQQGDTIQVTVSDTFNWLKIMFGGIGKLGGVVPATSTISSTAVMRDEASNTTTTPPTWVTTSTTACA